MLVRDLAARVKKLSLALGEQGADAFFASHPVSMDYLQGFGEDGYERFLTLGIRMTGEIVLICPALSATKAKRCGISDIRSWNDSENPLDLFKSLADEWNLRSGIVYVDGFMPAMMVLAMQDILPAALFRSGHAVLSGLMRKKDADELALLKTAAHIADVSLMPALQQLRPGMTESQFEAILRGEMLKLGGKPTFCIIAAGANSAEPHHESDDTPIMEGDVLLCDFGCSVGGYNSDTTRVVSLGRVSEEAHNVYAAVYEAQRAARAKIKAGVAAQEVDRGARQAIEKAGYGEYFIHRTGHGIGLKEHEEPYIVEGAENPLEIGECFSIEPGIYLPGKFGVRIENIVTPTLHGHESLNAEPSERLIEIRPSAS
jgi:Xaa-Pro dipeptidase